LLQFGATAELFSVYLSSSRAT